MKKVLALTAALLLAVSSLAFAAGPTIGLSIQPTPGAFAGVSLGYNFPDDWAFEIAKTNFATWRDDWAITALWVPEIATSLQDTFGSLHLRTGVQTIWNWRPNGRIEFIDLGVVLGLQHYWSLVRGYLQFGITATGRFIPTVGIQIEIPVGGNTPEGSTL